MQTVCFGEVSRARAWDESPQAELSVFRLAGVLNLLPEDYFGIIFKALQKSGGLRER